VTSFGFFLACEEFTPAQLLDQARLAQDAGFTHLAISDHYHPWNEAQGNSPFVWSMIGALSQVTDMPITTLVTCPTVRLHPVIAAQAAATSSVLADGRFRLGVGTGEALNEHILGDRWPSFDVRAEMLEEAVEVIRELFTGEQVTHRGRYYTAENAKLYNPPPTALPIHVSGFGPKAAALAGRIGDGYVTMHPDSDLVEIFHNAAGPDKPVIGGLKVCWDSDKARAVRTAKQLWPSDVLPGELAQILPTPAHFEQAASLVTEQMVADAITCGDDVAAHADAALAYVRAGFDEVYVGQIGQQYRGFFDFYGEHVLPRLAQMEGANR